MTRAPRPAAIALLLALAAVTVQLLLIPLFAGPASHIEPRDLPIVVAGPAQATAALRQQLDQGRPGAFAITTVADEPAADQALRAREAYAAFIVGPGGVAVHTASAAGPAVASLLGAAAAQMGAGTPVQVTDVVPLGADDPRGAGFAAGFFPLAISAMMAGVLMSFLVRRPPARLLGLVTFAAVAGALGAVVLQQWLGVVGGEWLPVAAVIALFSLAVSATVTGLAGVIGPGGIGLAALLILLVGNALSGVAAAPELLPQPWGAIGQLLPIGAGSTLLRSAAWFGGAGGGAASAVLGGWAAFGLLLVAVAGLRGTRAAEQAPVARADAPAPAPAAA